MSVTDIPKDRPRRKSISAKLRFAVLRRDGFRCQYCGCAGAVAALHIDHVIPVAEGGENEKWNLMCACDVCNGGKAALLLSVEELLRCPGEQARIVGLLKFSIELRDKPLEPHLITNAMIWGGNYEAVAAIMLAGEDEDEGGVEGALIRYANQLENIVRQGEETPLDFMVRDAPAVRAWCARTFARPFV